MNLTLADWLGIASFVVSFTGAVAGWINGQIKTERTERERVERELSKFRVHVAENYPSTPTLREMIGSINKALDGLKGEIKDDMKRIFDRLDEKQDKVR